MKPPPWVLTAAAVAGSALLCAGYAANVAAVGWVFGFVAFVPWLIALDRAPSWRSTLLLAWAMSVAFTAAVFPWFGGAIGRLAEIGTPAGLALLLLAAPLFQPQILVFALARHALRRRGWLALAGIAAPAAWVAAEWALPKLLGDTWGHGMYPSSLLRQAADLGGAAGLTLVLLAVNEAVAAAWSRRRDGGRRIAVPAAVAALGPVLLLCYGLLAMPAPAPAGTATLRVGLVQSAIVDYERLRRERGTGAVVREILDTHYAMTHDAVERQKVHAVLWSETVYPTTFGRPKSEAGAELDREILGIVEAARVPFVFGTYERDDVAEYNAAAFVAPGRGLVGFYRKTRLFPLTEFVPGWLDGPAWRRIAPWSGSWRPGNGARVMPLFLADGREVPVLPLICLDATDPQLAIAGARLGALAILGMSNDAWFSEHPQGARLHLAVAAFRSIETRLPQFRVTSNGLSAVIDPAGFVLADSRMGQRTLVIGELPLREPRRTLVVAWGDWVGPSSAAAWALLAAVAAARRFAPRRATPAPLAAALPQHVVLLTPALRTGVVALQLLARGSLLGMAALFVLGDGVAGGNTLAQLRLFVPLVLAPELVAWLLQRAYRARLSLHGEHLRLERGVWRVELARAEIAAVAGWAWPLPAAGAGFMLRTGERWPQALAGVDAAALQQALGVPLLMPAWAERYARARATVPRGRWAHPAWRFGALPLLLAAVAYQLHQRIVFGSAFGEVQAFGWGAFLQGFLLWWAAWAMAVLALAAVLRAAIEALTLAAVLLQPALAEAARPWLERAGTALLTLGPALWLATRALG